MSATWDLFITLFFIVSVSYGLLLGKGKASVILLSTYVGLAVASETGDIFFEILKKMGSISDSFSSSSVFTAKLVVFVAIIVLLTLKLEPFDIAGAERGLMATFLTGLYGFLSGGLILSSIGYFMSEAERASIFNQSDLAGKIMDFRFWWLVGPILVLVVAGFIRDRRPPAPK